MSYDLTIWCVEPFNDPALLPSPEKWTVTSDQWTFVAKSWQIATGPSDQIVEEDISEAVAGQLPGLQYLVSLSLEPLGAPKVGRAMLRRVAKVIAQQAHGVIFDPQEDTFELARGTKRFTSPKREKEERFGLLKMSWWMTNHRLLDGAVVDDFLTILETALPEAMPSRYGLYEPPQHVYAKTGRAHLKSFLLENVANSLVWYANRPVGHWSFGVHPECEWRHLGGTEQYRCNHLSVSFDTAALQQPGWPEALRRFWTKISRVVHPFFGDVRTLKGHTGRLPHVWSDYLTETHPTRAGWWKGVPPKLGHAIVVGEPYLALWPELQRTAETRDGLAFATTDDWSADTDVSDVVDVPAEIALAFVPQIMEDSRGWTAMQYPETYPEKFPFGPVPAVAEQPAAAPGKSRWKFWRK